MRYVLSRASRPILEELARERTLCAFDFDGTLAPITDHPHEAGMRERTRLLLNRLATLYPCVILSGRARADVVERLGEARVERVLGNHGAEGEGATSQARCQIEEWKAALEGAIASMPGLWVEDKGFSLAVHYRQSPRKAEARRRMLEVARGLKHAEVVGGKQVVNLVVAGAPNKGESLASERDRLRCNWVLFVGDDDNDEDAFALPGHIVAVRVGRKRQSRAKYYLRSQAEMDQLLELLVTLRASA